MAGAAAHDDHDHKPRDKREKRDKNNEADWWKRGEAPPF